MRKEDQEGVRRQGTGRKGVSRRGLLIGAGAGVGAAVVGLPALRDSQAQATVEALAGNGAWCTPAQGRFPEGGHYGAPRGGASHAGQDVSNPIGTAVYAAGAGTVIRRGTNVLSGRTGNGIVIDHGGGTYTYYGHLNAFHVAKGAKVKAGQRIADMGATGNVTGPHLHFETHVGGLGTTQNPVTFLAARGVDLSGGWSSIDPGASGETVKAIQYLLNQRGNSLVVDGDYASKSVAATKAFQKDQGLVDDGQVGPKTWPKLVYTLKKGANGNHVKSAQVALNKRSAGLELDGDFGSVTDKAVRNFQSANRLAVDGELGPKTWTALVG
ncbi:peptidoglycan-binding protein [Streptomyces sp. NPDC005438]|uniref:peptidoglycan-binding protein n=1 Tax=Streptomyces sp. NPDC005438 TaxID=3156880 RepID=UPI0033B42C47